MKYSEYFGAKRRLTFKNENISYDIFHDSKILASINYTSKKFYKIVQPAVTAVVVVVVVISLSSILVCIQVSFEFETFLFGSRQQLLLLHIGPFQPTVNALKPLCFVTDAVEK